MSERIARNADEVERMMWDARKRTDAAEDRGGSDQVADAIYETCRWVLGHADEADVRGFLAELDDD